MLQRIAWSGCTGLLLISLAGCHLLGRSQLAQCRSESEQLISDYRLQRDRAERLELENRTLHEQIARVEKKLALASKGGEERFAVRPDAAVNDATEQGARPSGRERTASIPAGEASPSATQEGDESAAAKREEDQVPPEDGWRGIPRS
ncbi:MAG: hypothetical protein WD119_00855 [Pirellulaceae bacterium]